MLVRQRTLWSADRAIGVKLGERAGDALSERGGGGVAYLLGLAYRPWDTPLQFSKISGRYHNTFQIATEFSTDVRMIAFEAALEAPFLPPSQG